MFVVLVFLFAKSDNPIKGPRSVFLDNYVGMQRLPSRTGVVLNSRFFSKTGLII